MTNAEFDLDPVHSTTRYREQAQRRFPEFAHPVPDIAVDVIPNTALLPLSPVSASTEPK